MFIDHAGKEHARATGARRIVSLVPSITELVCALDLAGELVGRTGFCIHTREQVRRIPKIGGTKTVDLAALRALAPTHVIVNVDENRLDTVEAIREFVPSIIVTHPLGPLDNLSLYRLLGGIFDREARAEALCRDFMAYFPVHRGDEVRERVLYLIWREPWMTVSADTYISRMLAAFGWQTWASPRPHRYPKLALEDCRGQIDRVLLSSEPYAFRDRHMTEVRRTLPEVPVDLIDGEMVSWYGPRAILGMRYLAEFTRTRS
jgi:ABC-type Fe3+-hydroxamate transport system substrate-binding protein